MQRPIILYTLGGSSCSWRVRVALVHKGIDYETKTVNSQKKETHTEEYKNNINPMGQIPVLIVNGVVLVDSIAIMEYLEEAYPQKPLLPVDSFKRCKVRQICQIIASGIQPLQSPHVARFHSDDLVKQAEWTKFYIAKGFTALEKVLSESSGQFCVGDDFSLADACLVPQAYNAVERFGVDMKPFPNIVRIYKRALEVESVRSTHPDTQSDQ